TRKTRPQQQPCRARELTAEPRSGLLKWIRQREQRHHPVDRPRGVAMKLLGKKALVTGAARGIGRGCALELARAGADVAINDRERTPQSEAVVAEIQALGRQSVLIEGDIFTRSGCESVVTRALEALGQLDILVSNPAYSRRGDFLDYDAETFEKVLQGTLTSGFHMSQLVAKQMVAQGRGGKMV